MTVHPPLASTTGSRRLPGTPEPGAPWDPPAVPQPGGRPVEPGLLEVLRFVDESLERLDATVAGDLIAAIGTLEDRLQPLLKQAPPMPEPNGRDNPGPRGPASEVSSGLGQQLNSSGNHTLAIRERLQHQIVRLRDLADRVDLS